MNKLSNKPYLMSLGMGVPALGLWSHTYIEAKRKHRGEFRFLGVQFVWATYKRSKES